MLEPALVNATYSFDAVCVAQGKRKKNLLKFRGEVAVPVRSANSQEATLVMEVAASGATEPFRSIDGALFCPFSGDDIHVPVTTFDLSTMNTSKSNMLMTSHVSNGPRLPHGLPSIEGFAGVVVQSNRDQRANATISSICKNVVMIDDAIWIARELPPRVVVACNDEKGRIEVYIDNSPEIMHDRDESLFRANRFQDAILFARDLSKSVRRGYKVKINETNKISIFREDLIVHNDIIGCLLDITNASKKCLKMDPKRLPSEAMSEDYRKLAEFRENWLSESISRVIPMSPTGVFTDNFSDLVTASENLYSAARATPGNPTCEYLREAMKLPMSRLTFERKVNPSIFLDANTFTKAVSAP